MATAAVGTPHPVQQDTRTVVANDPNTLPVVQNQAVPKVTKEKSSMATGQANPSRWGTKAANKKKPCFMSGCKVWAKHLHRHLVGRHLPPCSAMKKGWVSLMMCSQGFA